MRLIDADALAKIKFHGYPNIEITPTDVNAEAYKRGWNDAIDAIIESAPSIDSVPHWIPCSERLPEYGVPVLTYDGDCYCVEKRIPYICGDNGKHLISDWWVSDDYDVAYRGYDSDYYPNLRDGACIAWMPLPKPYKGEEDG